MVKNINIYILKSVNVLFFNFIVLLSQKLFVCFHVKKCHSRAKQKMEHTSSKVCPQVARSSSHCVVTMAMLMSC